MRFKTAYIYILIILLWGCSTKKNTSLTRGYHNLTAHYNVYFNGKQSYEEGVKAIEDANKDDYTQILSVFPDSKKGSESTASSQMDRAIEKGTKLIKKHSIRVKPEKNPNDQSLKYQKFLSQNEFNKWVDNAYLMIGKSHFLKHEYYQAQQSFAYMFREFQEGEEWFEAEIWNARAAIELGDMAQAKILLESYNASGNAPSKLYALYAATYADYHIRQENYNQAIPFLKIAAEGAWSRYYKRRFNFILAQLYQKQKQYAEASQAYKNVIASNPPYEMAFNAKVNRAGVMFEEGGLDAVKKEIRRLLRDKRNIDYEDRIYYALAMAYKAENEEQNAVDNFLLSISKHIDDTHQKGLSFYELYDIYYQKPEYKQAFVYLDTAVTNLNQNYPNINYIKEHHEDLSELVQNILTVEREDSLQRIAAMPTDQQLAFIDNLIEIEKARIAEEERKKQEAELASNNTLPYNQFSTTQSYSNNTSEDGKWYFYNQTSVGLGKMEFERKWGRRKLEDNWRRANKEAIADDNDFSNQEQELDDLPLTPADSIAGRVTETPKTNNADLLQRDTYLKNLPTSADALAASNKQIADALLNQGMIYKDKINNIPYAIDAFNEYISRFSDGSNIETAYMNLYLCYSTQADSAKMNELKTTIINKFPNGEFTAFLNDPEYFNKRDARNKEMEELYQQSYSAYLFGEFATPIENVSKAMQIDAKSELIAKFEFLAGLSYAKLGNVQESKDKLSLIRDNYTDSEVTPMAMAMLELYAEGRMPVQGAFNTNISDKRNEALTNEQKALGVNIQAATSSLVVDHNSTHSFFIVINKDADLNRLRYNIADYNFSKYLINDYEMSTETLPDATPVFVVSGFNNRLEALDYFYSVRERTELLEVDNLTRKDMFVANQANKEYILSSGDTKAYEKFFTDNYLDSKAFEKTEEEKKIEAEQTVAEPKEEAPKEVKKEEKEAQQELKQAQAEKEQEKQEEQAEQVEQKEEQQQEVQNVQAEEAKEAKVEPEKQAQFEVESSNLNVMILFKTGQINTSRTLNIFKNYTKNNFKDKYAVSLSKANDAAYSYVLATGFANTTEAKAYLAKVANDDYLMRDISNAKHYIWIIGNKNIPLLNNESTFEEYNNFFKQNY